MALVQSWRLAVGTLTAIPITPPQRTDRAVGGLAMVLAPLAVLPLAALVTVVLWGGVELGLSPLPVAGVALAILALGTRAFHLDGLADTADGLTAASHDRDRALAVMKTGDVGPAGAAAVVIVLLIQYGGFISLVAVPHGWWLAGAIVCASRAALVITCLSGIPPARADGLGSPVAGTVPLPVAVAMWVAVGAVLSGAFSLAGMDWMNGAVVACAGVIAAAALVAHTLRRLGGVTGDIYGAAIEISLAAMLLAV